MMAAQQVVEPRTVEAMATKAAVCTALTRRWPDTRLPVQVHIYGYQ
jgi:hypothetical protein